MQEYKRTSPSSDELVDLHISVVPIEYWMEKLNYASQKVIADTFSAGFIRVHPGKTISLLRKDIVEQIGTEFLPPNYVFLKHVGRCLALVREKQEHHLKVKNFIPPQSSIPEMFVLPARPSMYSQAVLPSIKPNLTEVTGASREKESPTTLLSSSQRPSMTSSHYDPSSLTQTSSSRASEKQANNLPNRGSSGTPSELARLVTGNSTAGPLNSAQKQIAKSNRDALPKPAPKAGLPPVTSRQADYAGQKRKSMSDQDTSPNSGGSVKKSHRSKPSHHGGTKSQKLQHSTPLQPSMDSDPTEFHVEGADDQMLIDDFAPANFTHPPNTQFSTPESFPLDMPPNTHNPTQSQPRDVQSPVSSEHIEKKMVISPDLDAFQSQGENQPSKPQENVTPLDSPSFVQPIPSSNASMNTPEIVAARPKSTTRRNHSQSNRDPSSGSTFAEDVSENRQHNRNGHEHGAHYSLHSADATGSERNLNGNGEAASVWSRASSSSLVSPEFIRESVEPFEPTYPTLTNADENEPTPTSEVRVHGGFEKYDLTDENGGDRASSSGGSTRDRMILESKLDKEVDFSAKAAPARRGSGVLQPSAGSKEYVHFDANSAVPRYSMPVNSPSSEAFGVQDQSMHSPTSGTEYRRRSHATESSAKSNTALWTNGVNGDTGNGDSSPYRTDHRRSGTPWRGTNRSHVMEAELESPISYVGESGLPLGEMDKRQRRSFHENPEENALVLKENKGQTKDHSFQANHARNMRSGYDNESLDGNDDPNRGYPDGKPPRAGLFTKGGNSHTSSEDIDQNLGDTEKSTVQQYDSLGVFEQMQIVQERRPIQTSDSNSRPTPNSIRHVNPPSDMPQKARLWHELQRVKERRHQFERERQSLVRKAKAVAMQVNQQRHSATPNPKSSFKAPKGASKGGGEQCPVPSCYYMIQTLPDKKRHFSLVHRAMYLARGIWKRRYFEEKKKTAILTELYQRLNSRLDSMQKKLLSSFEVYNSSEKRLSILAGFRERPSNKTNSKIMATKLQHSIDDVKRKLSEVKVKLAGEIKLRHQAEQDLKLMRHELLTKKIQSHAAYRRISNSRVLVLPSKLLMSRR